MSKRIIYYYQTFTNLAPILFPKTPVTHIHLSAIHFGTNPDGSPYIHLNDNPPSDPIFSKVWQDMEKANELGITIILMIGGAGGAFTDLFSNYSDYYQLLKGVISQYPVIAGCDLDIEEGVDLDNIVKLVNDLKHDFGKDFKITFAPLGSSLETNESGMGGFQYNDLVKKIGINNIEYFNGQFYGEYQPTDFENCVNNGYPPEKVVMGMIYGQDMQSNYETLTEVVKKYPDMGGTFMWEYSGAPSDWWQKISQIFGKNVSTSSKSFFPFLDAFRNWLASF